MSKLQHGSLNQLAVEGGFLNLYAFKTDHHLREVLQPMYFWPLANRLNRFDRIFATTSSTTEPTHTLLIVDHIGKNGINVRVAAWHGTSGALSPARKSVLRLADDGDFAQPPRGEHRAFAELADLAERFTPCHADKLAVLRLAAEAGKPTDVQAAWQAWRSLPDVLRKGIAGDWARSGAEDALRDSAA